MKHLKYAAAILLSSIFTITPFVGVGIIVYFRTIPAIIIGAILILSKFVLNEPLQKMRVETRRSVEYDEFGRSKSKGIYENLSKKERDLIDLQKTADMERVMSSVDMKKRTKKGSENPRQDMDRLIGLGPVKQKMTEMVARMEFEMSTDENRNKKKPKKQMNSTSMSGRHMVFYGSPGTGKTTVARILTGFLYQYGYIRENKCVEVDGNFLKAGADTGLKTELTVRHAFGGVLFIDEAYSLMDDPYAGRAAIAELLKQMEDNRDRFILILAGYTKEMKALLMQNPGFESRIKEYLDFPDYDEREMKDIFIMMAGEQQFAVASDALDAYADRIAKERKRTTFGNARTARNILDEAIDKHAFNFVNGVINEQDKFMIRSVDISRNIQRNNF